MGGGIYFNRAESLIDSSKFFVNRRCAVWPLRETVAKDDRN